jgi:hypothetical protein
MLAPTPRRWAHPAGDVPLSHASDPARASRISLAQLPLSHRFTPGFLLPFLFLSYIYICGYIIFVIIRIRKKIQKSQCYSIRFSRAGFENFIRGKKKCFGKSI